MYIKNYNHVFFKITPMFFSAHFCSLIWKIRENKWFLVTGRKNRRFLVPGFNWVRTDNVYIEFYNNNNNNNNIILLYSKKSNTTSFFKNRILSECRNSKFNSGEIKSKNFISRLKIRIRECKKWGMRKVGNTKQYP